MKYKKNKNWNMFIEDDKLFITKGADEIYYLDEADKNQAKIIYEAYKNDTINDLLDKNLKNILEILEKSGVIYKEKLSPQKNKLNLYIRYYGDIDKNLKDELINRITKIKNIKPVDEMNKSDLTLFIRTNALLKDLLNDYSKTGIPHILIDLGYAANISIGPIFYDDTACLGCYIGRLTKNWGDPVTPLEPEVVKKGELISSFIVERINEFITYGNCPDLVNNVWNYNTSTHLSEYNKVYKLPWCPHCKEQDNPKIDLPWEKEFTHE